MSISFCSFSQDANELFEQKILDADSVLIVSHDGKPIDEQLKHSIRARSYLVFNDTINYNIIREKILLDKASRNQLNTILFNNNGDSVNWTNSCFEPHHAIFLIKDKKVSHINICFGCRQISKSEDIKQVDIPFNDQRWKDLKSFFSQKGILYEMPKSEVKVKSDKT